jgi:hypothetical protein
MSPTPSRALPAGLESAAQVLQDKVLQDKVLREIGHKNAAHANGMF